MLLFAVHEVGAFTLPTGESAYKTFNGQNLVSSETDYNGNTTFYTYDEQGHIIQVTYPDQSNVKYYWCCCQICKYVDATARRNGDIPHYGQGNGDIPHYGEDGGHPSLISAMGTQLAVWEKGTFIINQEIVLGKGDIHN